MKKEIRFRCRNCGKLVPLSFSSSGLGLACLGVTAFSHDCPNGDRGVFDMVDDIKIIYCDGRYKEVKL